MAYFKLDLLHFLLLTCVPHLSPSHFQIGNVHHALALSAHAFWCHVVPFGGSLSSSEGMQNESSDAYIPRKW